MAKISYKQVVINHRITNLIGQNYNDDEIQEIIALSTCDSIIISELHALPVEAENSFYFIIK